MGYPGLGVVAGGCVGYDGRVVDGANVIVGAIVVREGAAEQAPRIAIIERATKVVANSLFITVLL